MSGGREGQPLQAAYRSGQSPPTTAPTAPSPTPPLPTTTALPPHFTAPPQAWWQ